MKHLTDQTPRHGEVYVPNETIPTAKQPFFGPGLWPTLITLAVAVAVLWTGLPQWIGSVVHDILTAILR